MEEVLVGRTGCVYSVGEVAENAVNLVVSGERFVLDNDWEVEVTKGKEGEAIDVFGSCA